LATHFSEKGLGVPICTGAIWTSCRLPFVNSSIPCRKKPLYIRVMAPKQPSAMKKRPILLYKTEKRLHFYLSDLFTLLNIIDNVSRSIWSEFTRQRKPNC